MQEQPNQEESTRGSEAGEEVNLIPYLAGGILRISAKAMCLRQYELLHSSTEGYNLRSLTGITIVRSVDQQLVDSEAIQVELDQQQH